jgi:hypothetical protein
MYVELSVHLSATPSVVGRGGVKVWTPSDLEQDGVIIHFQIFFSLLLQGNKVSHLQKCLNGNRKGKVNWQTHLKNYW